MNKKDPKINKINKKKYKYKDSKIKKRTTWQKGQIRVKKGAMFVSAFWMAKQESIFEKEHILMEINF